MPQGNLHGHARAWVFLQSLLITDRVMLWRALGTYGEGVVSGRTSFKNCLTTLGYNFFVPFLDDALQLKD